MARNVRILRGPFEGKTGTIIEDGGKELPATFFISIGTTFKFTTSVAREDVEIVGVAEA